MTDKKTDAADTTPPAADTTPAAGLTPVLAGAKQGTGAQPGDGSESATPVRAHGDVPAPADGDPEHDSVVNMAKHLDAWAQSFGEDALDRAVELAGTYRDERESAAQDAAKADAAQARAAAGTDQRSTPAGRSAKPSTTA